jgi:hypothetical protein
VVRGVGGLFVVLACGVVEERLVAPGYGSRALLVRLLMRRASSPLCMVGHQRPKSERD